MLVRFIQIPIHVLSTQMTSVPSQPKFVRVQLIYNEHNFAKQADHAAT